MPIVPVLDLMHGQVVRGISGRRQEYRPIVSRLTPSARPLDVALTLRDHFGFHEFYIADLDAIGGARPSTSIYAQLHAAGFRLWVDAGVRALGDGLDIAAAGIARIVVGLETIEGPATLGAVVDSLGADRVVFSLDLKAGHPLGDPVRWGGADAWSIAGRAIGAGVRHMLVLDLARVGMGAGPGTGNLCARLREAFPGLAITAGGGISGAEDVQQLYACGVDHVLVSSALHDGRLSAEAVRTLERYTPGLQPRPG